MFLEQENFSGLVLHGILFSIDLVVLDAQNRILVCERINRPAQGYWFVPGGRQYKNEPLANVFERICLSELGQAFKYQETKVLGLYDHFYNDSIFGEEISTHYVNSPCLIKFPESVKLNLPDYQHKKYRWVVIDELINDEAIHPFSKVFLDSLFNILSNFFHLDSKKLVNVKC